MDENKQKITLAELEAILNSEEDISVQILPNGEIVMGENKSDKKPLTMKEQLGGEYVSRI